MHAADPADPPQRGSGPSVPWTSGTVLPQPAEVYRIASRMKRANVQRSPLTMLEAGELQPPFVPELSHDADTRYFDPKYAQQPGRLSQASAECTGKMGVEPAQFEYVSPDWRHLLQGVGIADREDAVGIIGSLGL